MDGSGGRYAQWNKSDRERQLQSHLYVELKKEIKLRTGCGEPEAGVEGAGEVSEDGQQAHTSSCKTHNPWGCVYSKLTVVNNTALCMWKLLREQFWRDLITRK